MDRKIIEEDKVKIIAKWKEINEEIAKKVAELEMETDLKVEYTDEDIIFIRHKDGSKIGVCHPECGWQENEDEVTVADMKFAEQYYQIHEDGYDESRKFVLSLGFEVYDEGEISITYNKGEWIIQVGNFATEASDILIKLEDAEARK